MLRSGEGTVCRMKVAREAKAAPAWGSLSKQRESSQRIQT